MQYEVWELRSRNLVGVYDDEQDAVALVRRLLLDGWSADDLILGCEDELFNVEDLPPSLTGSTLVARARDGGVSREPRTV